MPETSGEPLQLNCLIEGESAVFRVNVGGGAQVMDLKEKIKAKRQLDTLKDVGPDTLVLWKVDKVLGGFTKDQVMDLRGKGGEELWDGFTFVSTHWHATTQFEPNHLHIIVELPSATKAGASTNWNTFHDILLSKLSKPIPPEFRVAPNAIPSVATRRPANFDLHLPSHLQLRSVKWDPDLINAGMERLKNLHPRNASARHLGDEFWSHSDIGASITELSETAIVTGEKQIQTIIEERFLRPICNIASHILSDLDADPPGEAQAWRYHDLQVQTGDIGPPLWDTVIKFSPTAESRKIPILIDCIIYAMELKSLTVAPSSFFYRLACRAATNISLGQIFPFQTCENGVKCKHAKRRVFRLSADAPEWSPGPKTFPKFNPTQDEVMFLMADQRLLNDDHADNSGKINVNATDPEAELSKHPRAHVALAIMRSGARPLKDDIDDDPIARGLAESPRRMSGRIQPDMSLSMARCQQQSNPRDCRAWKWEGGDAFEEHYTCVLQQLWAEMVYRDLTFSALTSLKHAVMVYRSRESQTLYVSTPFLPGARSPTLCQALLGQIISAYHEARDRSNRTSDTDDGGNSVGVKGGDVSKSGQGDNDDMGPHGDGGPSAGMKRKNNEPEAGPTQKSHKGTVYAGIEIPLATLSTEKQLHLSKSLRIGDTYMCIHDGFYDSEVTAILKPVFHSSSRVTIPELPSSPAPSLTHSVSTGSDSSMGSIEFPLPTQHNPFSLCLTQKLGKGAIGEVWKGVFSVENESRTVLDVAAKVGWFQDSPEHFLREAKIYDVLQKQDVEGVPVLIGLFDDVSDRVPILVTTYAGQMISRVNDTLKQQFRQILHDLHKAGICHGDLRKENMCCLNGRGSIIDFSHAFKSCADKDFETDVQELEELLASC